MSIREHVPPIDPSAPVDQELTKTVNDAGSWGWFVGVQMVKSTPGDVRGRLAFDSGKCTTGDIMHGGAIMGFADVVGGWCTFLNLPEDAKGTATIESKTNFFRAIRGGNVHSITRPLHKGRRTVVVDTELYDDDGKLVARVTQTQAVL